MAGFGQGQDEGHERGQDEGQVGEIGTFLNETEMNILFFLAGSPKTRAEIAEMLGMSSSRSGYLSRAIQQLRDAGLAELTIPEKPQSRNQRLRLTDKGDRAFSRLRAELREGEEK